MGCSQPANLTVEQESVGLKLPDSIAQIMRQTIAIQSLSSDRNNETVQIAGTVMRQAPLLSGSLYQVQDESSAIWIVSEASPPEPATTVRIVGTVQVEPINVEGIDISDFYLREQTRTVTDAETIDADDTESSEPVETEG
ncbi:MAG: hypothetical protein AAGF98_16160 [Cyanobacteria bacterium P01_H01_bin.153]